MLGANPAALKLGADVERVGDVDGEHDRAPPFAELEPVRDEIADQLGNIHPPGQFDLDVIAVARMDALKVWPDGGIDAAADEMALDDQVGSLRSFHDLGEVTAETATITTTWRGSQPEQLGIGIVLDNLAVGVGGGVVAFVDDDQVGRRHRHCVRPHPAGPQSGYRGHLNAFHRTKPVIGPGNDDAVTDTVGAQLPAGLDDDLATMGEEENTAVLLGGMLGDGGSHHRLAAARRRDEDHLVADASAASVSVTTLS